MPPRRPARQRRARRWRWAVLTAAWRSPAPGPCAPTARGRASHAAGRGGALPGPRSASRTPRTRGMSRAHAPRAATPVPSPGGARPSRSAAGATMRCASSPSTTAHACGSTAARRPVTPALTCPSRPVCAWRQAGHVLVVRADWRSPDAMKADAWHRSWFNFGGINREVTVRRLGRGRARRAGRRHPPRRPRRRARHGHGSRAQPRRRGAPGRGGRPARREGAALPRRAARPRAGGVGTRERAPRPPAAVVARPPATRHAAPAGRGRGWVHAARRPARAALGRRAPAAQRQAPRAAWRVDPRGRARPR